MKLVTISARDRTVYLNPDHIVSVTAEFGESDPVVTMIDGSKYESLYPLHGLVSKLTGVEDPYTL